jgi:DNA-directed RNA polymerase specialized sigma24 family protein
MDVIDVRQDLGAVDDSLYVRGVLGTLPDEQREALHMRCLEDLSFEEMGERLGITRQSAWERTQRALAAARGSAGDRADIDW